MMESKLTERIRKLLAMAEHPNSNEHEAAIAMQMAQQLLLENNLSRADVSTGTGDTTTSPGIGKLAVTEAQGYTWKRYLLHALAINSLCETVGSPEVNTSHIFGTFENVQGVVEMYHWLVPELERIAMKGWMEYKREGTGHERVDTWKGGFYMGATKTIGERLRKSFQDFASGPGHAIVLYNTQLVKDAVRRVFPYTSKSRSSFKSRDGFTSGRMAGNSIHLKPQGKLNGVLALK